MNTLPVTGTLYSYPCETCGASLELEAIASQPTVVYGAGVCRGSSCPSRGKWLNERFVMMQYQVLED